MLNMVEKKNETLQESYTLIHHKSGLDIYVFPKDFSTTYALLGTRYGSIDSRFHRSCDAEETVVPDGIAHFLEHKMFENENGEDTFLRFARLGASANAYTSFDKTCYLFSCTDHVYESLEVLLDYVTHPYFTPQTVKKEQGIIGQEIKMCEDEPSNRLLFGVLRCLYAQNPVKIDIAGTVDSISKITADLLYQCYNTFYNLHNMALCICGNVTPQEVVAVADRVLKEQAPAPAKRYRPAEDAAVCTDRYESKMSVSAPMFQIAIKDVAISIDPYERAKKRAQVSILCHMLFGKESDFFNELYDDNLIYTDLDYWFEHNEAFSLISLSGESDDPNTVWSKLLSYLETQKKNGLSRESFERYKRVAYADLLDIFDSTDSIANHAMEAIFDGFDLLELPNVLASVTYEEVCARFDEMFRKEYFAMGVISPYEKSEA